MTKLTMPRLGETVTEGVIVKWLKKEGDSVKKDEPVVEISTDKVQTDIPSPADGKLSRIEAAEGQKVTVGQAIAEIITEEKEAIVRPMAKVIPAPKEKKVTPTLRRGHPEEAVGRREDLTKGVISPLVRKLAKEKSINLEEVKGTGADGRITKDDVLRYEKPDFAKATPGKEVVEAGFKPAREAKAAKPSVPEGAESRPLSILRQQEAEHLLNSQKISAHVTAIVEADFTNIDKIRSRNKEEFKQKEGFSLSYLPFVAKAVTQLLQKMPVFNAELREKHILLKPHVNLGIAVALPEGLIVPVIKKADNFSLVGLARAINDVANRARENKLKPDEVHEGTFTITNNGSYGSLIQTPIIVPGQVAILSLEAISKRVTVIDDAIAIRKMAYLPLTYDHRLIDGSQASTFLVKLKKLIEEADFESLSAG